MVAPRCVKLEESRFARDCLSGSQGIQCEDFSEESNVFLVLGSPSMPDNPLQQLQTLPYHQTPLRHHNVQGPAVQPPSTLSSICRSLERGRKSFRNIGVPWNFAKNIGLDIVFVANNDVLGYLDRCTGKPLTPEMTVQRACSMSPSCQQSTRRGSNAISRLRRSSHRRCSSIARISRFVGPPNIHAEHCHPITSRLMRDRPRYRRPCQVATDEHFPVTRKPNPNRGTPLINWLFHPVTDLVFERSLRPI